MLTLGSALVAGAILLTALIALFFRRPDPPRWTEPDLVAMLVAVPVTGIMALGLGYMMVGVYRLQSALDLYEILGTLAVLLVAAVIWRLLGVRRRLRAYAAAGRANLATQPGSALKLGTPAAWPEQPAEPALLHAA